MLPKTGHHSLHCCAGVMDVTVLFDGKDWSSLYTRGKELNFL